MSSIDSYRSELETSPQFKPSWVHYNEPTHQFVMYPRFTYTVEYFDKNMLLVVRDFVVRAWHMSDDECEHYVKS